MNVPTKTVSTIQEGVEKRRQLHQARRLASIQPCSQGFLSGSEHLQVSAVLCFSALITPEIHACGWIRPHDSQAKLSVQIASVAICYYFIRKEKDLTKVSARHITRVIFLTWTWTPNVGTATSRHFEVPLKKSLEK